MAGPGITAGNATAFQGVPLDPTAPTDGQVPVYSAATGKYAPGAAGGGSGTVTSVAAGNGLVASPSPVVGAGTISLDVAPLVASASTLAPTVAQTNKPIALARSAGSAIALPAATGAGMKYRFIVTVVAATGSYVITAAGSDVFIGAIPGVDVSNGAVNSWTPGATDNTISLNGTTTGAHFTGDWVEVTDIASAKWAVSAWVFQSGSVATPFSHV